MKLKKNNKLKEKVLIVVAHPDDEVLGCGGTLLKHVDEGDKVYVLFVTEGVSGRYKKKETTLSFISRWSRT